MKSKRTAAKTSARVIAPPSLEVPEAGAAIIATDLTLLATPKNQHSAHSRSPALDHIGLIALLVRGLIMTMRSLLP